MIAGYGAGIAGFFAKLFPPPVPAVLKGSFIRILRKRLPACRMFVLSSPKIVLAFRK